MMQKIMKSVSKLCHSQDLLTTTNFEEKLKRLGYRQIQKGPLNQKLFFPDKFQCGIDLPLKTPSGMGRGDATPDCFPLTGSDRHSSGPCEVHSPTYQSGQHVPAAVSAGAAALSPPFFVTPTPSTGSWFPNGFSSCSHHLQH